MSVCSGVRAVLVNEPTVLTSSYSDAHSSLPRSAGRSTRNCELFFIGTLVSAGWRLVPNTEKPSFLSARAIARPSPEAAPVTRATLFSLVSLGSPVARRPSTPLLGSIFPPMVFYSCRQTAMTAPPIDIWLCRPRSDDIQAELVEALHCASHKDHDGKHFPKASSNRGDPLIRIFRRSKAQTRLRSFARKPSHVWLSAVTTISALPL